MSLFALSFCNRPALTFHASLRDQIGLSGLARDSPAISANARHGFQLSTTLKIERLPQHLSGGAA
jgi:hypothetical protein